MSTLDFSTADGIAKVITELEAVGSKIAKMKENVRKKNLSSAKSSKWK